MNPITAVITNIVQQGLNLVVFVTRSDIGQVVYNFGPSDTPTSIQARIQSDIDSSNGLAYLLSTTQSLIGTTFQTDSATLTTLQANIQANISAATTPVSVSSISTSLPNTGTASAS